MTQARAFMLAALVLALGCRGAPSAVEQSAAAEPPRSRPHGASGGEPATPVIACDPALAAELGDFRALVAGGRFALFAPSPNTWLALDLTLAKVAARGDGMLELDISCGEHCAAYAPIADGLTLGLTPQASELRLRNLITGADEGFDGEPVADAQLPVHLVALRAVRSLGLLDARARKWLARVETSWPASSVAWAQDAQRLYVLSLDPDHDRLQDPHAQRAWLEVFAVASPGTAPQRTLLRYSDAELARAAKFDGALIHTSEPRVYRIDSGELVVGHMTGCLRCAGRFPEAHLYRVIDAASAAPGPSTGFEYLERVAPSGLAARVWQPHDIQDAHSRPAHATKPVPEQVARVIADASRCR